MLTILLLLPWQYAFAARDLSYPAPGTLILGDTKYEQVIALYGDPKNSETKTNDQGTFLDISYDMSGSFRNGFLPMRRLGLYFKDNVLIGYDWYSSFKDDSTDFDETKISQIKKGETTWQQAAEIINTNYGVYTYPRTDSPDERALVYMFIQYRTYFVGFKAKTNIYTETLTITYGKDDVVTDISLNISGEKQ